MDPFVLMVYIFMYLSDLSWRENVTVSDVSWTSSDNLLGTLHISNIQINGFNTLNNSIQHISVTEDENGNNNACVLLPLDYLELTLNYDANFDIDSEISIYGNGHFLYRIEDVKFNSCFFLNNERYIDDVVVQGTYRHKPLELTGFWKHREINILLERRLNVINRFIAMWNAYEPKRASCLWSPFVSYAANVGLKNENVTFQFDPTCLKKIFSDGKDVGIFEVGEPFLTKIQAIDDTAEDHRPIILKTVEIFKEIVMRLL